MLNARGTHNLSVLEKLLLRYHGPHIEANTVGRVHMHHPSLVVMFTSCEGGHRDPGEEEKRKNRKKGKGELNRVLVPK